MERPIKADIPKRKLIKIIQKLLKSDLDLDFLLQLEERALETLVAAIRAGSTETAEDIGSVPRTCGTVRVCRYYVLLWSRERWQQDGY